MNQEEINRVVSLAENASAGVKDPIMKAETYKIVLTEMLRNIQAPSDTPPSRDGTDKTAKVSQPRTGSASSKVATWAGVGEDVLSEVFEFGDTGATVRLSYSLLPKKVSDAQRLLTQFKLSVDKIGYDIDEVSAKALNEMFDDHGCKDGNVAKNLKASEFIISKGSTSKMKSYKLRYSGINTTLKEIQNVLGVA